jgi:hypothetical protein
MIRDTLEEVMPVADSQPTFRCLRPDQLRQSELTPASAPDGAPSHEPRDNDAKPRRRAAPCSGRRATDDCSDAQTR